MALAMLGALAVGGPASAARKCVEPEPVLTYDADHIDVTLTVDYTGCAWWRKRVINMSGGMDQAGVLFGVGMEAGSTCFGSGIVRWCEINLDIFHAPAEATTYTGYLEYPWKQGTERIDFEYLCVSAVAVAQCEEQ